MAGVSNILFILSFSFFALELITDADYSWWNYPGLELWKFVNLFVFIAGALYLHRRFGRPIREALRARSERIKRELIRAQEERDQALAKLAEVESRFQKTDAEVAMIKERARAEADAERERIKSSTEMEISKLREQAKREIESAGKAARQELRRFAAQESLRLAEEILAREIGPEDDARLTTLSVNELGRTEA
jgi:F-type H+-transporting ATPase subunit b